MQQPEHAAAGSQVVITSDKDEVVHDEVFIFEASCLMSMFTVVCREQAFLQVQIRSKSDDISSEVECKKVDTDDVVNQVHIVQAVVELIVGPYQVMDVKEQVALTRAASKL